jgi:hypothetical protein
LATFLKFIGKEFEMISNSHPHRFTIGVVSVQKLTTFWFFPIFFDSSAASDLKSVGRDPISFWDA